MVVAVSLMGLTVVFDVTAEVVLRLVVICIVIVDT